MSYKLHKLTDGFIITSDEEILPNTLYMNNGILFTSDSIYNKDNNPNNSNPRVTNHNFKVIAQQNQIDFSALSEKDQKEIGWFDVEQLALEEIPFNNMFGTPSWMDNNFTYRKEWIKGFKKAQELLSDKQFTLNEVKGLLFKVGNAMRYKGVNYASYFNYKNVTEEVDKVIQSISKPKSWEIELEMEINQCDGCKANYPLEGIIHIVSYPSGKMVCQKSKYDVPKFTNNKVKILKIC